MVQNIAVKNVWNCLDGALVVSGVIVTYLNRLNTSILTDISQTTPTGASNCISGGSYVDFSSRVPVAQETTWYNRNDVFFIIDALEVRDLIENHYQQSVQLSPETTSFFTFESTRLAQAGLPTRGVPYVKALTSVEEGRFNLKKTASNSANAPPSEWPTCFSMRYSIFERGMSYLHM
jgi:hypothetical protein